MIELNHLLSKKWGTLDDGYGVGDGGGGRHGMVMVAAKNEERRASAADRPLPRVSTENVLAGNLDYFPAKQLPRVSALNPPTKATTTGIEHRGRGWTFHIMNRVYYLCNEKT
jgi:hypothetical protein